MSEVKEKTLADLRDGEDVVLRSRYSGRADVIKIKRLTPTQIIIPGAGEGTERKFWKKDGTEVGNKDSWYCPRIFVADEKELLKIKNEMRYRAIAEFKFQIGQYDTDSINEVYEWLLSKGFITERK